MHPWPDWVCAWNSLYLCLPCDSEETVCEFVCTHTSTVVWMCHCVAVLHWETIGLPHEPGCQGMDHLSSSTALMTNKKGAFFHRISMAVIACDRNGFPVTPWLYEEALGILSRFFPLRSQHVPLHHYESPWTACSNSLWTWSIWMGLHNYYHKTPI